MDLARLERGKIEVREQDQLLGYVAANGREYILNEADFRILATTSPLEWEKASKVAQRGEVDLRVIELLVEFGFLLSDADDAQANESSRAAYLWDEDALWFHHQSKWEGQDADLPADGGDEVEARQSSEDFFAALTERMGRIPGHFHQRVEPSQRISLQQSTYQSPLTETLRQRRTTRHFDTAVALNSDVLATVLQNVFGCQGTARLAEAVTVLKKTSPSGGAMHPVEVYPLVLKVDGIEPGIYHYHVGDHALEPIAQCSEEEGRDLARRLTAGQAYFASAHVLLFYTARFERSFWKYRRNPRAYKVAHLDLGHLSQTLYLMCTELGLGAFFTAACNETDIEGKLEIDGISEGAIAIGGLGVPAVGSEKKGLQAAPLGQSSTTE